MNKEKPPYFFRLTSRKQDKILPFQIDLFLKRVVTFIKKKRVKSILLVPPDITRLDSLAGNLTVQLYRELQEHYRLTVLPATGLHAPMKGAEKKIMFSSDYKKMNFLDHCPRHGCVDLGRCDLTAFLKKLNKKGSELKKISQEISQVKVELNQHLFRYDLILSLGQVVPHEVLGMSNFTKNLVIGLGGYDLINKTHWLSALHGIEKIIFKSKNPIRSIIDEIFFSFLKKRKKNIFFLFTVVKKEREKNKLKGLFWGENQKSFLAASRLSLQVNQYLVAQQLKKAYVWMPPEKYHYTWLSNKAIYRLKKVMQAGGELIILALGVRAFYNQQRGNQLIKKIGYRSKKVILQSFEQNESWGKGSQLDFLAVWAHLIHSGDIDFHVTYVPHPKMKKADILKVGFGYLKPEWGKMFFQKHQKWFAENFIQDEVGYFYDPGLNGFDVCPS